MLDTVTSSFRNAYDQPIGAPLPGWTPPPIPPREPMTGRHVALEPLHLDHADALFEAFARDLDDRAWTYLPYGPFASRAAFHDWVAANAVTTDLVLFAICPGPDRRPAGIAGYLRMMPAGGSIEVGHLRFSADLQQTAAATEAMYLMMRRAFDLGYRRYEWKCDAFNTPSWRADERLGFAYEGTFRQATVYKGRSRDTAWFSVIDSEWPSRRLALESWLDPANFDAAGRQIRSLAAIRAAQRE